jgi:hypothetical protein
LGVWERAAAHARLKRCSALAKALALLDREPKAAMAVARGLLATPLQLPARVVLARAELATGDAKAAWADFQAATAHSSTALADPSARHDAAVAAAQAGEALAAAGLYRGLIAERALLPRERRTRVLLEAALAVLRLGPEHSTEAADYLQLFGDGPAERPERPRELALLALVLTRAAQSGAAEAASGGADGLAIAESLRCEPGAAAKIPYRELLPQFEERALLAVQCESADPAQALRYWQEYASAVESAPWSSWVAARIKAAH